MITTVDAVIRGLAQYSSVSGGQYPAVLDSAPSPSVATVFNPLFGYVLSTPVTSRWIKKSDTCYVYDFNQSGSIDAGDNYFQYSPAAGLFCPSFAHC
jgi:hypothetical protein